MKQTPETRQARSKRGQLDLPKEPRSLNTIALSSIVDLLSLSLYQFLLAISLLVLTISTTLVSAMDLIRSLIFSQAQTAPEKVNHEVSTEEHVISLKNYRQNSTTEEDPLAVLRELRSTHEILPSELRDLGAETLEEAMEKAKVIAAGTSNTSSSIIVTVIDTSSNTTIPPPPFKRISTTTTTSDTLRFIPVPLGRPRSAEHIALLYQLCQKRAIQPEFAFEQHGIKYKASLKLGNVLLRPEEGVTYGTKKEAKEVLAKKGVELVKQWEEEDEIKQREADARGEGAIHGQSQAAAKEVKDTEPQENWVGMLLGKLPLPFTRLRTVDQY